jgi:hypothetical protein
MRKAPENGHLVVSSMIASWRGCAGFPLLGSRHFRERQTSGEIDFDDDQDQFF